MKRLLLILIFTFSFQSWTNADDISDFQIEGMSIGDSLLDHFSENEIKNINKTEYKWNNKFYQLTFDNSNFENYDAIKFQLKTNDNRYIIYSISGAAFMDISSCLDKRNVIFQDILEMFDNPETTDYGKRNHPSYKNTYTYDEYVSIGNDMISVSCYEFGIPDFADHLLVSVDTSEFNNFLNLPR